MRSMIHVSWSKMLSLRVWLVHIDPGAMNSAQTPWGCEAVIERLPSPRTSPFACCFTRSSISLLCNIKNSQEHDSLIHIWEYQIHQDRFSKKDGGANKWIELENGNEAAHSTKRHNNTALLLSIQGEVGLPAKLLTAHHQTCARQKSIFDGLFAGLCGLLQIFAACLSLST